MTFLLVLLAASPLKTSADAAYRAKKYEVACPQYEQLAKKGRDAWAWNDLALCETKRGAFEKAMSALETASKLEQAVPEEKLRKAIDFNRRLLAEGVVSCSSEAVSCDRLARDLTKLVTEPKALRRQLFARAVDVLSPEELDDAPELVFDRAVRPFEGCAALRSPHCDRSLLLCRLTATNEKTMGLFIDPADEGVWSSTKIVPEGTLELVGAWTEGPGRCPPNRFETNVIDADACTGRVVLRIDRHDYERVGTERREESLEITRPPPAADVVTKPLSPLSWRYDIDPTHSSARFSVKHLGVGTVTGTLGPIEGRVVLDGAGQVLTADAKIDLTAIDTKSAKRDEHLRSADFFDVAQFPTLRFTSMQVFPRARNTFTVVGVLKMRALSRSVRLEATLSDEVKNPLDGTFTRGLSATGKLNRRDWGLTWGVLAEQVPVVGDEVTISIDVEIVRQP